MLLVMNTICVSFVKSDTHWLFSIVHTQCLEQDIPLLLTCKIANIIPNMSSCWIMVQNATLNIRIYYDYSDFCQVKFFGCQKLMNVGFSVRSFSHCYCSKAVESNIWKLKW